MASKNRQLKQWTPVATEGEAEAIPFSHEGATQDEVYSYGNWDGLKIPVAAILTAAEERRLGRIAHSPGGHRLR